MTSPMRIGVAGAGLIGRRHVELIEASPDYSHIMEQAA
jgi:homoserine dehydrogenase